LWCSSARPTGDEAKADRHRNCATMWPRKSARLPSPRTSAFGDNLPKTRSGKIMRRLLRSIAKGEAITQDTSTLENPAILDQLGQAW
jgi:acetyl-CoA synthetase